MQHTIVIRADASHNIGSGHVMRCLTLAHALKNQYHIQFLCRPHTGNMIATLQDMGFSVTPLKKDPTNTPWTDITQNEDAQQCLQTIKTLKSIKLIIVDHYALDHIWETQLKPYTHKLLVIDDLADRPHNCDYLLDQNQLTDTHPYKNLLSAQTRVFLGTKYALLRNEFTQWRNAALKRHTNNQQPRHCLINFGGMDSDDLSTQTLHILSQTTLIKHLDITLIMGQHAPHIHKVKQLIQHIPHPVKLIIHCQQMAKEMTQADFIIASSGSTVWEICCLALPAIIIVEAENQHTIAQHIQQKNAAIVLNSPKLLKTHIVHAITRLINEPDYYQNIARNAAQQCNGNGVKNILKALNL